MKLRLTPLNLVSSFVLVSIGYQLFFPDENKFRELGSIRLIILLILSFIADQVFRRYIPQLKRIWLIEVLFLIFVAVLMTLIKLYVFS
jgi:drug/metabolite transporter (DMT)-like permease